MGSRFPIRLVRLIVKRNKRSSSRLSTSHSRELRKEIGQTGVFPRHRASPIRRLFFRQPFFAICIPGILNSSILMDKRSATAIVWREFENTELPLDVFLLLNHLVARFKAP